MNIWLVNIFDPLPGDPEQQGRYASLARVLAGRGHEVTWWTSSFSHRFKRPVDQDGLREACGALGIDVRFLAGPPYRRNVGLRRLRNHRAVARQFARRAPLEQRRPDVVLASAPPPFLCREAGHIAERAGARFVVDVQDAWPETFYRLAPRALLPLARLALHPWRAAADEAYAHAQLIVGVADAYAAQAAARAPRPPKTATVPLGVDVAAFDRAAEAGRCDRFTKPPGHTWLVYSGSLNRSYDCLTILRAWSLLRDRDDFARLHLFVTGRGELAAQAEAIVRQERLANVALTGFVEFNAWAYLLSQCDIGLNASFPEAMIYLPNKVFWYFAAALAVLNTIPGQCSQIVTGAGAGLDYAAGDVAGCRARIEALLDDRPELEAMQAAARRLAETEFDRNIIYERFADTLEEVASAG